MKEFARIQRIKYLLCIMVCMILLITGCGGNSKWQEQYDLGLKYLEEGNYEEAIVVLTAAIEIDPKNPLAFISRGSAYINLGETEENLNNAQADYEQAISLDEQNEDGWLGLADVYIRRGDYDKATEILKEGFEKINGTAYDENTTTSADTDAGNNSAGTNSGETDKAGNISLKLEQMIGGNITDASGKTRKSISYDTEGNVIYYKIYEYDSKGKHIKSSYFLPDGTMESYETYEHDENGNQISQHTYEGNGALQRYWINEYDENGKMIKNSSFESDGTYTGFSTFEYNNKGNIIQINHYFSEGVLSNYQTWEYDENDHVIRDNHYNGDGSLDGYIIHEYDQSGKMTKTLRYNRNGELTAVTESQ